MTNALHSLGAAIVETKNLNEMKARAIDWRFTGAQCAICQRRHAARGHPGAGAGRNGPAGAPRPCSAVATAEIPLHKTIARVTNCRFTGI